MRNQAPIGSFTLIGLLVIGPAALAQGQGTRRTAKALKNGKEVNVTIDELGHVSAK